MLFGGHPLWSYAIVGLGAAAYSPAKYGILTELLPTSQLVKANGWIEGPDDRARSSWACCWAGSWSGDASRRSCWRSTCRSSTPASTRRPKPRSRRSCLLYVIAALFNLRIPRTEAPLQPLAHGNVLGAGARLLANATRGCGPTSWARSRWPRRRCSGACRATCACIVLAWAAAALGYSTTQASSLVGVVAIGTAAGAIVASLRDAAGSRHQRDPAGHGDGRAGDRR